MRLLKRLLKIFFGIIGMVLVTGIIALVLDILGTSYLKVGNGAVSNNATYLITHANIVPMHQDTVLMNKMVYIQDGIIKNISENLDIKDIELVDAKGKFLLPGLMDMHVHLWDRYELGLYLSNGVTAVRNLWGMPMHLRIKTAINNDKIIAPHFFTTGPKLTGPAFIGDDNLNLTTPGEARDKVISYKDKGYDFIKTYYGLNRELFDAVLEQAAIAKMDIVAHPSQKVPFTYHLKPQIKSLEHAEEIVQQALKFQLDSLQLRPIIDSISNVKYSRFCPTITVFNNIYQMLLNDAILDSESLSYMNPLIKKVDSKEQFDRWHNAKQEDEGIVGRIKDQHDFHLQIIAQLHKAGVPIICGTDAGIGITLPGFSIHQELAFYKEAGLSNYEVLRTATVNAAQTHYIMNQLGTIEEGKVANLLLLDNNPLLELSTLKNPSSIFIKGRQIKRKTLHSFKEKAKKRKNLITSALRYSENLLMEK